MAQRNISKLEVYGPSETRDKILESFGEAHADEVTGILAETYGEFDPENGVFPREDDKIPGLHPYTIKAVDTYDFGDCEEDFQDVYYFHLDLPDDGTARRIADEVEGEVVSGFSGKKSFKVAVMAEIVVDADTPEQAIETAKGMSRETLLGRAVVTKFVKATRKRAKK